LFTVDGIELPPQQAVEKPAVVALGITEQRYSGSR
jgi:hypothetical protein